MPKRYLTGGGFKKSKKSEGYLYKTLNYVKSYTKKSRRKLKNLNKKLTFSAYDRIGGVASRAARMFSILNSTASRAVEVLFSRSLHSLKAVETRAQEALGANCFRKFSLTTVCRKIQKVLGPIFSKYSLTTGKILPSIRKLRLRSVSRGAILIEFAICMPVLIILLFYINDLVRIKRYYSQTEFVGQQMANILQNIAKTRAITKNDIKRAAALAYLSIYPGTTMFTTVAGSEKHIFSHQPRVYVHYVKGESGGKASTTWALWTRSGGGISPDEWHFGFISNTDQSAVSFATNVTPSSIYPTLKVEEGKAKILIDVQIRREGNRSAREIFGLHFVNPKYVGNNMTGYFSSVVIFTPNGGFSENRPS